MAPQFSPAKKFLIVSSGVLIMYHFLILTQLIDYHYVWGGRLQSSEQMYVFEILSIIIQSCILLFFVKTHPDTSKKFTSRIYLFLSLLFAFSTLGNVLAVSLIEQLLFTPLAAGNAIAAYSMFSQLNSQNKVQTK